MIKWMLIWQILNGGVVISGMTFDTKRHAFKQGVVLDIFHHIL